MKHSKWRIQQDAKLILWGSWKTFVCVWRLFESWDRLRSHGNMTHFSVSVHRTNKATPIWPLTHFVTCVVFESEILKEENCRFFWIQSISIQHSAGRFANISKTFKGRKCKESKRHCYWVRYSTVPYRRKEWRFHLSFRVASLSIFHMDKSSMQLKKLSEQTKVFLQKKNILGILPKDPEENYFCFYMFDILILPSLKLA